MGPQVWACILVKPQFEKYIPEKSIHDAICKVYLVPNNLNQVKKMVWFLKELLKEKNMNNSLVIDEIQGKILKRTLSVMGPLSKVWLKLENAKKSDAPPLSLDEVLSLLEQTICLLGETINSISYHWRYNNLSSVCSHQEAKNMLENKVELLQTNDKIFFRKEFSDHLTESVKSKKSSKQVFLTFDCSKKPFRFCSWFQQQQRKNRRQKQITTDYRGNQAK